MEAGAEGSDKNSSNPMVLRLAVAAKDVLTEAIRENDPLGLGAGGFGTGRLFLVKAAMKPSRCLGQAGVSTLGPADKRTREAIMISVTLARILPELTSDLYGVKERGGGEALLSLHSVHGARPPR